MNISNKILIMITLKDISIVNPELWYAYVAEKTKFEKEIKALPVRKKLQSHEYMAPVKQKKKPGGK